MLRKTLGICIIAYNNGNKLFGLAPVISKQEECELAFYSDSLFIFYHSEEG